jgi:hypothetical protein
MIKKFILSVIVFCSLCILTLGQGISKTEWYSESNTNGIVIQNSLPKGGRYTGTIKKNYNYSQLVFFTRVVNKTGKPMELMMNFSADSIPIPNSPDTFVKVFLPSDTMTLDKRPLYNYGVGTLASFDKPTRFHKTILPNEECLFYVVGIFYQTRPTEQYLERGGNRAELVLKGQDLFYSMPPQIDSLPCGRIVFKR